MPRVSVIIPTYNRRDYVQEAIDSVLAQTFTDYEIIVIDDGSTDGTGEALRARYGDRIHYEWQGNQGESVARNRGIELARGEYIAFLDSDDLWLPEKLEKQVAYLDAHLDTGAVFCQSLIIDSEGNPWPSNQILGLDIHTEDLILDNLLCNNIISAPMILLVRRNIINKVGGFDTSIRYGEDWDFSIRLRNQVPIAQLDEPLCCIRYHYDSQCHLRKWEAIEPTLKDRLRVIEKGFALLSDANASYYRNLRRRAETRQYVEAALAALAWGEYEFATLWLNRVVQGLKQQWINPLDMGDEFSQLFLEIQNRTEYYDVNELWHALSSVSRALQMAGFSRRNCRMFKRRVWANLFFSAARRNDYAVIRWVMPRLLCSDLALLGNLGVWSIGLEALLGRALISPMRQLFRRLQRGNYAFFHCCIIKK